MFACQKKASANKSPANPDGLDWTQSTHLTRRPSPHSCQERGRQSLPPVAVSRSAPAHTGLPVEIPRTS